MNLHHAFAPRPTPQLPNLAEFAPCFDAIPQVSGLRFSVPRALRPVYWWATELAARGVVLQSLVYDEDSASARVVARMPSYRVVNVVRRAHDASRPGDLLTVLAEAVWRCGALGWGAEVAALREALCAHGVVVEPRVARRSTPIPGLAVQPSRVVRAAYWWARALSDRGWQLESIGEDLAGGGFVAVVPGDDGEDAVLAVYPGGMCDDGTEASALAGVLADMTAGQVLDARRVIGDAAAESGRS